MAVHVGDRVETIYGTGTVKWVRRMAHDTVVYEILLDGEARSREFHRSDFEVVAD